MPGPSRISFLCWLGREKLFTSRVKHTGQINAAELWSPNNVYQLQQAQSLAFVASILFISSGGQGASPLLPSYSSAVSAFWA